MSRKCPECLDSETFECSVAADVVVRGEPGEEEEDEEDEKEDDEDEGYSE
jgi:hypothetical protein